MNAKKLLTTLFSAALTAAAMCPLNALSEIESRDGWRYSVEREKNSSQWEGEKYIKILRYIASESENPDNQNIVIPEEIDDMPVRRVQLSITSDVPVVSIKYPSTMTCCDQVDYNYSYSTSTMLMEYPKEGIDENLKKVDFSGNMNRVTFVTHSFRGTGIEELKLPTLFPEELGGYQQGVFAECKSLKKAEFSSIDGDVFTYAKMFRDCTALEEVIMPQNMQSLMVREESFSGCTSLEKFPFEMLGKSSEIGKRAFAGCGFGDVFVNCYVLADAFEGCKNLETLTIGGDASVRNTAFKDCTALKSVTINGNPELALMAFKGDENLSNINISDTENINGSAFNDCLNLLSINGQTAFDGNTGDFVPELRDFIINNFANADDVGFMNEYVKAQVKKIVSEITTPDMNDMQKIKTIHDWICKKVKYDSEDIYNSKNHTDCSVFVGDSVVCEGYARAFNLLLNEAGVETYYVTGVNHAWNIVNLDGHYFHIDLTWDDSDDENINYNYFLKSDNQIKDNSNHSSWKLSAPSSLHDFQGNTLPECSEIMGDLNSDIDVNVADLVLLNKYLLNNPDCGNLDKSLADLNFDGNTDVFDLVNMRKNILE